LSGLLSDARAMAPLDITLFATSTVLPSTATLRIPRPDINRNNYYKNRMEFSVEAGSLPINIPFVFDFLMGDGYNMTPLKYTLAPIIASLRWQINDVSGPSILRGNWESSFSGTYTMIPRGPETRFFAYVMGIRRNFVQPRWRISPYLEGRVGTGDINAKGPKGVAFAQGQDYTFTLMLGSGLRYHISPRYAFWGGAGYMHISNLYLSEPRYLNYGINVWGPMFGVDVRLGKRHPQQTVQQDTPAKAGL
jgi:lipid A 3-O-deacylase PagL